MAWAIFSMLFLAIGGVVYGAAALIWFALTILADVYESGRGRLEVYNSGI